MYTYITLIFAVTMLIAQTCTADSSYWIDSSCYEKNADFAKTIAESMEMASGAASKNQANEANMKYIAGWIFNMKAWSDAEQVQKNYEIRGIVFLSPFNRFHD